MLQKLDKRFAATHALEDVDRKQFSYGTKLFIFDGLTVGVDVEDKAVCRLLASLLRKGVGIIIVSSCLPEVYEFAGTRRMFSGRQDRCEPWKTGMPPHEIMLTELIGL